MGKPWGDFSTMIPGMEATAPILYYSTRQKKGPCPKTEKKYLLFWFESPHHPPPPSAIWAHGQSANEMHISNIIPLVSPNFPPLATL